MLSNEKIERYNTVILQKMSTFLNIHPDFIERSIIDELVNECGLERKEAFTMVLAQTCGLDIENSMEDMELFREYFINMIHELDTEEYKNNAYYKQIKLPEIEMGRWAFRKQKYKPYEAFVCDDLKKMSDGRVIPQIGFFSGPFYYPTVFENNREWMLITPNEIETMQEAVERAQGKVLTYGLGLGYYAYMVSEKDTVQSVTVVEKDETVISLFNKYILPQFKHAGKIRIVNQDAFCYAEESMGREKYNFIFTDIWHDPSDGVELYLKMKSYEKFSPESEYMYWIEKTMRYYLEDK